MYIYIGMMHTKTSKNPITHSRLGNPTNNKIAYLLRSGQNVPKSCFRMIHFVYEEPDLYIRSLYIESVVSFFHHIFIK